MTCMAAESQNSSGAVKVVEIESDDEEMMVDIIFNNVL